MKNIPLLIIIVWTLFIIPQKLTGKDIWKDLDNLSDSLYQYESTRGIDTGYYNLLEVMNKSLEEYRNHYGITHEYLSTKAYYGFKLTVKNYTKGIEIIEEVIDECKKRGYTVTEALASHKLAKLYLKQGNSKKALTIFLKDAEVFKNNKLTTAYPFALIDIGNIYYKDGIYEKALYYYRLSAQIFMQSFRDNELNDKLVVCYQNMGLTFDEEQQADSALYYYHKALKCRKYSGQKAYLSLNYSYLGSFYARQQQWDSAEYYIKKAVENDEALGKNVQLTSSYNKYFQFLLDRNKIQEAKAIALKNYHYTQKYSFESEMIFAAGNLGYCYYALGNTDSAYYYYKISIDIARKTNRLKTLSQELTNFITVLKKMNRFEQLPEYYEELIRVKDKLSANKATEQQLKLEMEQRNMEQKEFRAKEKKQKTVNLFLAIISLLVITILFVIVRAEIKMKKSNEQLQKALDELQKTTDHLNMTYSIVAHDLKGPVGGVVNLMEMLLDGFIPPEEWPSHINTCYKTLNQSYALLLNLLNWSRLQGDRLQLNPKKIEMISVVKGVIDIHRHLIDAKSIHVQTDISPDLMIYADKNVLNTVFRNLLSNAIKFTPEKGEIKFSAEETDDETIIKISDSGIGMTAEQIENIFKPDKYETTKGTHNEKGSGLGLKLVIDLVKRSNGKITIDSKPGEGTVFEIRCPKKNQ